MGLGCNGKLLVRAGRKAASLSEVVGLPASCARRQDAGDRERMHF
jgi:hypothetical protein